MDGDEEEIDYDMMGLTDIERTNEERDEFVAFSYANGVEQRYVVNDNPQSFVGVFTHIHTSLPLPSLLPLPCVRSRVPYPTHTLPRYLGWEVHVESQGVGYLAAVRPPTFAGTSIVRRTKYSI